MELGISAVTRVVRCGLGSGVLVLAVNLASPVSASAGVPYRVVDLNSQPNPRLGSDPTQMVSFGNRVIFSTANLPDGITLRRAALWSTDGTPEQTREIMPFSGVPMFLTVAGPYVYFLVGNGVAGSGRQTVLWRTDGSAAGTAPLHTAVSIGNLTAVGDEVAFVADEGEGPALHFGSVAAGTRLVRSAVGSVQHAVAAGGRLFFMNAHGFPTEMYELWSSDGTAEGTLRLAALTGVPSRL